MNSPPREIRSREELLRLVGRRAVRRRPAFGQSDRTRHADPSLAPTREGLSCAITVAGPKTHLHAARRGVFVAEWRDGARGPGRWVAWEEWAR